MKKDIYFSILIQDYETMEEIDAAREMNEENYDFNAGAYVCYMFCGYGWEENEDNFTDYEPYIGHGEFVVARYQEYTLVRNLNICGDYMLYRKATEEEVEWLKDNGKF